ncbi:hypothetical protein PXNS11_70050 [Stutzerimonas xanthomarina]|nr:hypothetical protein PXNS11_70050 [Stutzerimonas xanthomarina]
MDNHKAGMIFRQLISDAYPETFDARSQPPKKNFLSGRTDTACPKLTPHLCGHAPLGYTSRRFQGSDARVDICRSPTSKRSSTNPSATI